MPDPRHRRGMGYPWRLRQTIVVAACSAGAPTLTDVSDFGNVLEQAMLQDLSIVWSPDRALPRPLH